MKSREEEKILVRLMEKEDLEQAIAIEQSCFPDPWSERVYRQEYARMGEDIWLFCARRKSLVVGTISLTRMGEDGEIGNVAVLPEFRRRGIGSLLLHGAMEYGKEMLSMHAFTLEVRSANEAALHMYEKQGFVTKGIRPRFYTNPVCDALIMWKEETND